MNANLLFVFDHQSPRLWRDGLRAALALVERRIPVRYCNLRLSQPANHLDGSTAFVLGWGAIGSPADRCIRELSLPTSVGTGLVLGGTWPDPQGDETYHRLFFETQWHGRRLRRWFESERLVHAFGCDRSLFVPSSALDPAIDALTVGAFALWKRQEMLIGLEGLRLAVGEIQAENREESMLVISRLLQAGVAVAGFQRPESLLRLYLASRLVYIPASLHGGGERVVLEARACGRRVVVERDNPKLEELVRGPVYDEHYFASQLFSGLRPWFAALAA